VVRRPVDSRRSLGRLSPRSDGHDAPRSSHTRHRFATGCGTDRTVLTLMHGIFLALLFVCCFLRGHLWARSLLQRLLSAGSPPTVETMPNQSLVAGAFRENSTVVFLADDVDVTAPSPNTEQNRTIEPYRYVPIANGYRTGTGTRYGTFKSQNCEPSILYMQLFTPALLNACQGRLQE
jgi:hypothetical protein